MATIIKTDSAKLVLTDTDEHELIPAPVEGQRHIITHVEFINNDSAAHTPKIRIRDDSDRAKEKNTHSTDETEYTPLSPAGISVDASGGSIDMRPPLYTLRNIDGAVESLVVEDSAKPTDEDNPTTIIAQWLVEKD